MSDVTVSVVENTTSVVVSNDVVEINVTESPVTISTGTSGPQGASGVGYTGVTSTSTITIGSGLKTFTLVAANQGAFLTGMRIRAIHSDTPTYYMEGTANYVGGGTLIITVDKFNGSGSHNLWAFASAGEVGQTGATGASGVVSVTSPITNTGTAGSAIVGIDQTLLSLTQSQVTNLTTDLANTAKLNVDNTFTNNINTLTAGTGATKLVVKQGATQASQNLQEWQDSVGAPLAYVNNVGRLVSPRISTGGAVDFTASFNVSANSSAVVAAIVKGASGQSANLQEWQNSGGTALARVSQTGSISTGGNLSVGNNAITNTNQFQVSTTGTAQVGAVIRGFASQSASLQEWQNSAGGTVARVSSAGSLRIGGEIGSVGLAVNMDIISGAGVGAIIRGANPQTANLQEWQNSGGTAMASISSAGALSVGVGGLSTISSGGVVRGVQVNTNSDLASMREENTGGVIRMTRGTAIMANPAANQAKIYLRDGTNAGTLKLVVRAGAAGAETTILDNIPQ